MHGYVNEKSSEDVVFSCRIDRRTSQDEYILCYVQVQVVGMVGRETSHDPAAGEDEAGPEHEEGDAPELVAARIRLVLF